MGRAIELTAGGLGLVLLTAGAVGFTSLNPVVWIAAGFLIGLGPTVLMR